MKAQPDYRALVHTPAELATEHVAWAERIKTEDGIRFGIPDIDKKVIPMRAGDEIAIIARPGMGKTSIMAYLARETAKKLPLGQAVVYVTWEQSAEELEAFFQADGQFSISDIAWGRADLDEVKKRAVKRAGLPIWVIGHGIGRAGQKMPRMTPEVVLGAIESMQEDYGVTPALMLFDYMQLVPVEQARDRIQQVTEVPILIKELALRVGAPAVVGVQARREVDDRDIKLPELRDAQWASSIEQTCDKVFALWRPFQTEIAGSRVQVGNDFFIVNESLMIFRMLKQRGDAGRYTWGMHFDPAYLRLGTLAKREPLG